MCNGGVCAQTLQLQRRYDLAALAGETRRSLEARTRELRPAFPAAAPVTILRASAQLKLRQLAATGLSDFDFERILHALETNVTSLSLEALAAQLSSTADAVQVRSGYGGVAPELRAAAASLRALHAGALQRLRADTSALSVSTAHTGHGSDHVFLN